ncbi:MAG TPA: TraG family conjugative transposon ATPase, partial [Puia sp.]|nr:TraG family conjugative transposon ATPase [Puia sp.]
SGIRLGGRLTGIPRYVDISDAPLASGQISNRNKFVLGGSGSGKSFLINLFIRCYFANGAHILLVDVGGSYKNLCSLLGGLYLTYEEHSPICLNPFQLEGGRQPDIEKKESIITLLLAISKKGDESFNRFEYVALSNALRRYYEYLAANPQILPCFNTFYEFLTDHYSIILKNEKVREKNFDLESFLFVLRPYYKGGEYDYLLNAVDQPPFLHQQLIIFELDNIKDHPILFPVVTIIIMETFISKMRKLKGVRKIFIIEEAWKALAKEGMSEYIKYLFRTVRKFFGEAILVTQDLEDIISNPIVKNTIINNSDCKLLLDQSKFKHRFQQVQEVLGLNEKDKTMILSLNKANDPTKKYKEVFISLVNGPSKVYRVEVSLEEYLVYTTEEREKEKLNEYSLRYGGIRKGVAALAADIKAGLVRFLLIVAFSALFMITPNGHASAQIIELIEAAVKEALVTADLKIQRLQTQTLLLQNAQKAIENNMQEGLLDDITSWVQQQENLYSEYYQELWQVKSALSEYSKVRYLVSRQAQLVKEYQQSWTLVREDPHFSAAEISHIANVYTGILNESVRNIGQLTLAVKAFATQMDDAGRLRLINETGSRIDRNYSDLRRYNQENTLLSLQRAKDQQDLKTIRTLYGIQ